MSQLMESHGMQSASHEDTPQIAAPLPSASPQGTGIAERPTSPKSLPKSIHFGMWAVFVFLVVNVGISYRNTQNSIENERRVSHTYQVLGTLKDTFSDLQDAETGQRGYVITGQLAYLAPYQTALTRIEQNLQNLQQLTADNPTQAQRIKAFTKTASAKLSELRKTIQLRSERGFDAAQQRVMTNTGKQLMDTIRQQAAIVEREESQLLKQRLEHSKNSAQQTLLTFVAATTADLLLLSVVYFLIWRDRHDRQRSEQILRTSEARYRSLAETIPQLVWTTTAQGQNEYVNRQFCEYTGLSVEQLLNLDWLTIIHPDDRKPTREHWFECVKNGDFYEIEYRFRRFDGKYRWFLGQGVPHKNEQGEVVKWFGTCTDIHQQRELKEAQLLLLTQEKAVREEAERANRIKDEFLAVLSHELRSPLNPILGWTRLLQTKKLDEVRQLEALATIERNAKLQSQLIEDLLDISRILQGKLTLTATPTNLAAVIPAAAETVQLAAEAKNIHLNLELGTVDPIWGDAGRLQQVVWNLLTNAVKFTPDQGQVTVKLTQTGCYAQIQVIDTGKGIDPKFLPYVFEYFRQEDSSTTRRFGGLGLGLAIARQIVELHGGTIGVDSVGEGHGAVFVVRLPIMPPGSEAAMAPSASPVSVNMPLQNLRILVVDDDADTRNFHQFLLEQNGAIVTVAASGHEALQWLDRDAAYDLLLSDIGMADMDGYTLMRQIRLRLPSQGGQIPAIALTAYASEPDQKRSVQAGFQHHMTKPIDANTLIQLIVQCV